MKLPPLSRKTRATSQDATSAPSSCLCSLDSEGRHTVLRGRQGVLLAGRLLIQDHSIRKMFLDTWNTSTASQRISLRRKSQ